MPVGSHPLTALYALRGLGGSEESPNEAFSGFLPTRVPCSRPPGLRLQGTGTLVYKRRGLFHPRLFRRDPIDGPDRRMGRVSGQKERPQASPGILILRHRQRPHQPFRSPVPAVPGLGRLPSGKRRPSFVGLHGLPPPGRLQLLCR